MIQKLVSRLGFLPLAILWSSPAAALTLDFEGPGHGAVINTMGGVGISGDNFSSGPDLAVIFDTTLTGTADQDLQFTSPGIPGGETGWAAGNLPSNFFLGNILIIQENDTGCATGTCSNPDDEGSRPAGTLTFDFSGHGVFRELGFDIVDVESESAVKGSLEFFLGAGSLGTVSFNTFTGAAGMIHGNNTLNRIAPVSLLSLGLGTHFDRVSITMGGSSGLDNVVATPIPEPSSVVLFAAGFAVVAAFGRHARP